MANVNHHGHGVRKGKGRKPAEIAKRDSSSSWAKSLLPMSRPASMCCDMRYAFLVILLAMCTKIEKLDEIVEQLQEYKYV